MSYLNKKNGSISILFILLLVIVLGVGSFSLYVGQSVTQKIKLQNTSDWSAYAMGAHSSQGLNIISSNNLAIGSSLHISSSVPILATYMSLAYAFTADEADLLTAMAESAVESLTLGMIELRDRYQEKVWNNLIPISATYMGIATGLTKFNNIIADYWQLPIPFIPVEISRVNIPDSLGVGLQGLGSENILKYDGIIQSTPKEAICKTIKSSKGIDNRDNFMLWFAGPLRTMGTTATDVVDKVNYAISLVDKILPIKIGYVGCGYGLKYPLLDAIWQMLEKLNMGTVEAVFSMGETTSRLNSIYNSHKKDFDWYSVTGAKCKVWDEGLVSISESVTNTFGSGEELIKRFHYEKYLAKMKKQSQTMNMVQCRQATDNNQGFISIDNHIAHVGSNGEQTCLDLKKLDTSCVFIDFLEDRVSSQCNNLKSWIKSCKTKYGDLVPGKKRIHKDFEDPIVDFAEQSNSFSNGLGMEWGLSSILPMGGGALEGLQDLFSLGSSQDNTKRSQHLGFLFVLNQEEFSKSISSVSIVVKGLKQHRSGQECPKELKNTINEVTQCDKSELISFAPLHLNRSSENTTDQLAIADHESSLNIVRAMSSGMRDLNNHMDSEFDAVVSKVQVSRSSARAVPTHEHEENQNSLFWPGWQSSLTN